MGFGDWFSRLGVVVICVMPIMAIANWLYRLDLASLQCERNELAEHFVGESLASNVSPAPFSLYLRPFSTTNRLLASALPMGTGPSMHKDHELVDMEALMERALRPCVTLIGLGSDNESHDGAGRIAVSDDDWQRVVSVLATKATIRFIAPLDSPSTQWELKWLSHRAPRAQRNSETGDRPRFPFGLYFRSPKNVVCPRLPYCPGAKVLAPAPDDKGPRVSCRYPAPTQHSRTFLSLLVKP